MIASAVAEGLQARADVGRDGDKAEAVRMAGAEPLAEWEQELLAGATATASPTAEVLRPAPPRRTSKPNRRARKADIWRTTPLPMSSDFGS